MDLETARMWFRLACLFDKDLDNRLMEEGGGGDSDGIDGETPLGTDEDPPPPRL